MDSALSKNTLEYIVNHVALPPKLPQKCDRHLHDGERALIKLISAQVFDFQKRALLCDHERWSRVHRTLCVFGATHYKGQLTSVQSALRDLDFQGNPPGPFN